MKIFAIHGKARGLDELWLPALKEDLKGKNVEIIAPLFPVEKEISLKSWYKVMDEYKDMIDENTIFLVYSLGTNFIFKYLYKYKKKCKAVIAVAGGYSKRRVRLTRLTRFVPWVKETKYLVKNVPIRYHITSDKDGTWLDQEVRRFNKYFKGEVIVVPGAAHFGLRSGVKKIPELTEIINKLEKAD